MAGPNTGRSIGAVVAGFLSVAILSLVVDQVLHMLNVYPPWGEPMNDVGDNALALSYRIVITVFGGWLTARLAPQNPMKHAIILGVIGTAFGILGVFATMGKNLGPMWYPIALAASGLPCTWLGGILRQRQTAG